MRFVFVSLAISLTLLSAMPAFAGEMQTSADALEAAMAQSQAAAIRPGDEALTCEQLQAEMTSTMNDPAMQAQIQTMGAQAQSMQDRAKQAQSVVKTQMAAGMAMGVASSFVPGLGYAQAAAIQAQAVGQQKQAAANQREMAGMADSMQMMMPQMMRGQQLYELAQAQKCAFIEGSPHPNPAN